ncbi:MAG: hypothetical protein K8F91_06195, partial [Candidatus Obscuribacterales bacterium]|nr:hypothetical protein [Candidatus Obscuribacterales bacterium]
MDGATGEVRITPLSGNDALRTTANQTDGRKEFHNPDGSMEMEICFNRDESTRQFKFENGFDVDNRTLKDPLSMTVTDGDGNKSEYKRSAAGEYEVNGKKVKAEIELSKDPSGRYSYSFKNLDTGYSKSVTDGRVEVDDPGNGLKTVEKNGRFTSLVIEGSKYSFSYDGEKVASMQDERNNRHWQRSDDGTFSDAPLDAGKPYEKPNTLETAIAANNDLTGLQKARMMQDVETLRKRDELEAPEKNELFKQASRLLDTPGGSVFSADKRAGLCEQLLWHSARATRNEQGSQLTCNVTTLRGVLLHEKPSVVGKLVADVTETGKFVTKDGTTIKPPLDSLKARKGSSEAKFPPVAGNRTA